MGCGQERLGRRGRPTGGAGEHSSRAHFGGARSPHPASLRACREGPAAAEVPSLASDVAGWGWGVPGVRGEVFPLPPPPPPPPLPVKRVLLKTLLPNHGSHGPGHQVRVILGTVAHEVAEAKLPGLRRQKHSTGSHGVSGPEPSAGARESPQMPSFTCNPRGPCHSRY